MSDNIWRSFTSLPRQIDAVQYTGDNVEALNRLIGPVETDEGVVYPIEISNMKTPEAAALLWVAANTAWVDIEPSEWIARDALGLYPIKDAVFMEKYVPSDSWLARG